MKSLVTFIVSLALVFGLVALFTPADVVADPGNGKGLGVCKHNGKNCAKWCGIAPEGCGWMHCTRCGCELLCE